MDEATGRPIINPDAKYSESESANVTPGPGGAHNWSPMSFNPTLGLLYVSGQSGGGFTYAVQPGFEYNPKGQNMGIVFGRARARRWRQRRARWTGCARRRATPALQVKTCLLKSRLPEPPQPLLPPLRPPAPAAPAAKPRPPLKIIGPDSNGGFLVAYDPATGTERWRVPGGSAIGGGTVATAGDIVFQATNGTLYAYSADKGEKLLELKTGISGGMAPPITFMVDGKQYVALQVGQGRPGRGQAGTPRRRIRTRRPR